MAIAISFGVCALSAQAGTVFSLGNNPQTDEAVLFHDSCAFCVDGPALTVSGHTQGSDLTVNLTSDTNLTAVGPGHSTVSTDTGFSTLSIAMPGYSFSSIILQLTSLSSAIDGTVVFTAHTVADGNISSAALFDGHTGGNYFTITTDGGTLITQLDITTTQLQHDISQIRIGGSFVVPEPGTFGLAGIALGGLALFVRRRNRV